MRPASRARAVGGFEECPHDLFEGQVVQIDRHRADDVVVRDKVEVIGAGELSQRGPHVELVGGKAVEGLARSLGGGGGQGGCNGWPCRGRRRGLAHAPPTPAPGPGPRRFRSVAWPARGSPRV